MSPFFIKTSLYLLAALLFLGAFFAWEDSSLRWVYFFCGIVFGTLGFSFILRERNKKGSL